ncbi:DUF4283 domain-containing protein, partial [Cephalotus follicularis]
WSRISRVFNGQSFLLLRWSSDSKRSDSPLATVWMRLPGLPLPLHNPSFFKAIGDSLGRYLCSDAYTTKLKNPRAARICLELDISKPLPSAFIAAFGELQFHQRILIESQTSYCTHCLLQGHLASSCRNRKGKCPLLAPIPASHSGKDCCGSVPSPMGSPIDPPLCQLMHSTGARQVLVEMPQWPLLSPTRPLFRLSLFWTLPEPSWLHLPRPTVPPTR